jgi:hypothetical protein
MEWIKDILIFLVRAVGIIAASTAAVKWSFVADI